MKAEPIATRVMLCAPAAITRSCVPDITACAAKCSAGQLRSEDKVAAKGEGLLARLANAADVHIVDRRGIDTRVVDQRVEEGRAKVGGMNAHQRPLARPPAVQRDSMIQASAMVNGFQ